MLRQLKAERLKGPLQARAVKQDVWPCIEGETVLLKTGRQTAGCGARFDDAHAEPRTRQPDRRCQPTHSCANDDDSASHFL